MKTTLHSLADLSVELLKPEPKTSSQPTAQTEELSGIKNREPERRTGNENYVSFDGYRHWGLND